MANYILLVFEGQKTEVLAWDAIKGIFENRLKGNTVVCGIYGNEIYSLYRKIVADPDLDLFSLLREIPHNQEALKDLNKDDVSEIFLFFDYDGHVGGATDEQLRFMLEQFKNETDGGKLYISYPMVESLKHIDPQTQFENIVVGCKVKIGYKNLVSEECSAKYKHFRLITEEDWKYIFSQHCKKLNFLMTSNFTLPEQHYSQIEIFDRQLELHIKPNEMVAVLSAFPIFISDYFGRKSMQDWLEPPEAAPETIAEVVAVPVEAG